MIKDMYSLKNIKFLAATTRLTKDQSTTLQEPQGGNKKRTFFPRGEKVQSQVSAPQQGQRKGGAQPAFNRTRTTFLSRIGKLPKRVQVGRSNDRLNEYQSQYKAKQEIKKFYGNLSERDLINFVKKTRNLGNNDQSIISLLERKLDVVVFRLGFSNSIPEARFLIKTGQILVDNKKIRYNHYLVENGSIIKSTSILSFINKILCLRLNQFKLPSHLSVAVCLETTDSKSNNTVIVSPPIVLEGIFIKNPLESEVYLTVDFPINKFNYFINKY